MWKLLQKMQQLLKMILITVTMMDSMILGISVMLTVFQKSGVMKIGKKFKKWHPFASFYGQKQKCTVSFEV